MLSAGRATANTADLTRTRSRRGLPSTSADKFVAPSMNDALIARSCATLKLSTLCPHTFGALMFMELTIGKNSASPAGTVHERLTVPPLKVPARNQVGPRWPTMQLAPLVSRRGLTPVGIEVANSHQCADKCGKPSANAT